MSYSAGHHPSAFFVRTYAPALSARALRLPCAYRQICEPHEEIIWRNHPFEYGWLNCFHLENRRETRRDPRHRYDSHPDRPLVMEEPEQAQKALAGADYLDGALRIPSSQG
jgi:hypothetical protein